MTKPIRVLVTQFGCSVFLLAVALFFWIPLGFVTWSFWFGQ